jgi:3-oxoadipate CoA-transferase, alpha subunit
VFDKVVASACEALADVDDGAAVMVGGFGGAGAPVELIHALLDRGARELVIISNNTGVGDVGLGALIRENRVRKVICSFPRSEGSYNFIDQFQKGRIELELVPQGTLAERIRAAGAGIPAFYTPTAARTLLTEGKEHRQIDGKIVVLERALSADVALIKGHVADRAGNLLYNKTARNFGPIMAMAASTTIAQCSSIVATGSIDPEVVVTPGIFVDRVVLVDEPLHADLLFGQGVTYP